MVDQDIQSEREEANQDDIETRAARIRHLLIRLKDQRSLLTAHFKGLSDHYSTMLLGADPDRNELCLDELKPAEGDQIVQLRGGFHLSGQLDGAGLEFPLEVRERHVDRGMAYYLAGFPEAVHYRQRRKAFRVEVPAHPRLKVTLTDAEGHWFEGQALDLSITGIGFQLPKKKALALPVGTRCECRIELPDEPVEATVDIRFNRPDKHDRRARLGAHFIHLNPPLRRRIERHVARLQREQLKRMR